MTEIHWNPSSALGQTDADHEFIKLENMTAVAINLAGWEIKTESSSGTEYTRMRWNCEWSSMYNNGCDCITYPDGTEFNIPAYGVVYVVVNHTSSAFDGLTQCYFIIYKK